MHAQIALSLGWFGEAGPIVRPLIVAAVLYGLWKALAPAPVTQRARRITWWSAAAVLVGWMAVVWTLAARGGFESLPQASPIAGLAILPAAVILPVVVGLLAARRSRSIAAALAAAPLSWLIGVQVYRVLGLVFLRVWSQGLLPGYFALPAGIGDTLVGLTALPVAFALGSNWRGARGLAVAWNVFGILDLVNALSMGVTSSLAHAPAGGSPLQVYPLVLIPAFAVPLSLLLHGVSLLQLRRSANSEQLSAVSFQLSA
ncbi:MAG: hypothetical protein ACRD1L_00900 [Terriglobales bacterium]